MLVMIRMRSNRMMASNCNGCQQKHMACTVHCVGAAAVNANPTAEQRVFNNLWQPQIVNEPSHVFTLFAVNATRQRFPGNWRLITEQGIGLDDYRSGQGTMVCVRP